MTNANLACCPLCGSLQVFTWPPASYRCADCGVMFTQQVVTGPVEGHSWERYEPGPTG